MRHGTEAQESAPNPGKAVRGQAKTTATALFSLPSGAVPVYDVRQESRWYGMASWPMEKNIVAHRKAYELRDRLERSADAATPRTDEAEYDTGLGDGEPDLVVPSKVARQLERELAEAKAALSVATSDAGQVAMMLLQNDRDGAMQWARDIKLEWKTDGTPRLKLSVDSARSATGASEAEQFVVAVVRAVNDGASPPDAGTFIDRMMEVVGRYGPLIDRLCPTESSAQTAKENR